MSLFIDLLSRLGKLESQILELTTRVPPVQLATVTAIDPVRRLIQVSRENQAGLAHSDWIQAGRSTCYSDEPLPTVGTTVLVAFANGDPHDGYLMRTLANATNPPDLVQQQPENDNTIAIPNDDRRHVGGISFDRSEGDRTVETGGELSALATGNVAIESTEQSIELTALGAGGKITLTGLLQVRLQDSSGAYIQMASGLLEMGDRTGRKMTMGAGDWSFDLAGGTMAITNASSASLNGAQIATVGAIDSDSDTLVSRGWS